MWPLFAKRRCRQLQRKCKNPHLLAYLQQLPLDQHQAIENCDFLALDFETSGLNAKQHKLLSLGYTQIHNRQILLNECQHKVVTNNTQLTAENVHIHHLTDSILQQGEALELILNQLLAAMTGKILLVHFARIEVQFLQQACLQIYGIKPVLAVVDTLAIELNLRRNQAVDAGQFRLPKLRKRYQLPKYQQHNALNDAIATAEVFLAQMTSQQKWHKKIGSIVQYH